MTRKLHIFGLHLQVEAIIGEENKDATKVPTAA